MYDHEISPAVTCDAIMAHWTSSGNTLAAYDFSVDLHCPLESYDVKNLVNIVASYCCGTGDAASRRSACWADYSHVCATPANYQGSAMYACPTCSGVTCDAMMAHLTSSGQALAGKDFSSAFSCSAETYMVKYTVDDIAKYCCGTGGVSACWVDHSYLCADPSSWAPSHVYDQQAGTTCIQLMNHLTQEPGAGLEGDDFSSASTAKESCTKSAAPGKDPRAAYVHHVGVDLKCCSSGNSVCLYHEEEDDDDDDDGGSELVMSGGLVAIGLTFTGISIAAIANAVQEQCALGPTIVYEAGTTHPYYISPNLCSIGTKTYASKKTVRDVSPRKVCRKFCEAASEKGKLALKHVQGLTCYCKRK